MEALLANLTPIMVGGVITVVVISQLHRATGAVLGFALWASIAVLGTAAYDRGHAIGALGVQFSQMAFYCVCAFFAGLNLLSLWSAWRHAARNSR